ncbi:MAG: Ig-like domain-containing protein [Planctomycetota bacterium]
MITRTASWRLIVVILALVALEISVPPTDCRADEKPRIGLTPKTAEHPATFEAIGLPEAELARLKSLEGDDPAFAKIFTVSVANNTAEAPVPPVGGSYRVDGTRLVFTPRYPPLAGLKYRAVLRLAGGTPVERELALPKPKAEPTEVARVEHVYPTSDLLPENHLRFYIHFSQPIERGTAYQHLELLDAAGKPVDSAFLELGEELWDPSGRRFTLLLDPGRIKQGLKPREELGPILQQGKKYTLVVKPGWRDVHGKPLAAEHRKQFSVGPVIDEPIDTKRWKFSKPRTGTTEPLSVRFPQPLDRALLERTLSVVDGAGQLVTGKLIIADSERRWEFTPSTPWTATGYQLVVDTVLEDTVGNSIGRAFEVDEQHPITSSIATETVQLPITLTPEQPDTASRP